MVEQIELSEVLNQEKKLTDLLFFEQFRVLDVKCETIERKIYLGELLIGVPNPQTSTGYIVKHTLEVAPFKQNIKTTKLIFNGFRCVCIGNEIEAGIYKVDTMKIPNELCGSTVYDDATRTAYYERKEFIPEEEAVIIKLLNPENRTKILRTETSINYIDH